MSEHWLLQLKWGDVPAWVGAILTSTSLLIAALSYRRSVLDKERDQASKVAAWITLIEEPEQIKRVLRISNGSDASIYDLTCRPEDEDQIFLKELPAKAVTTVELGGAGPAPNMTKEERRGVPTLSIEMTTTTEVFSQEPSPEIEFCDALGKWWRRAPGGGLERIPSRTTTATYTISKSQLMPNIHFQTEPLAKIEKVLGVFYGERGGQVGQQYVVTNWRLLMGPLDPSMGPEIGKNVLSRYAAMSRKALWLYHIVDVHSTNNASWFKAPGLEIRTDTERVFKLGIVATPTTLNRHPKNNAVRDQAVEVIRSAVQAARAAPPKPVTEA